MTSRPDQTDQHRQPEGTVRPDHADQSDPLGAVGQLAIIGTGLLGTSVGLALKAGGFRGNVLGVARREATLAQAREVGGIDAATTDVESAITDSQLAILAVPLGAFEAMLARIGSVSHDRLVLTDVGSTKSSVLAAARRHLPESCRRRFVGAHPMAGSEQQGPEAANPELFRDKPCIITSEPDTDSEAVTLVEALWRRLGMRLLHMTASEHDEAVATVSHLPHAVATLLIQVAMERGGWEVASTGFRDTTRLASSNPPMRADILAANREAILGALDVMRRHLDAFAGLLNRGDIAGVLELLESSRSARERWLSEKGAHRR